MTSENESHPANSSVRETSAEPPRYFYLQLYLTARLKKNRKCVLKREVIFARERNTILVLSGLSGVPWHKILRGASQQNCGLFLFIINNQKRHVIV